MYRCIFGAAPGPARCAAALVYYMYYIIVCCIISHVCIMIITIDITVDIVIDNNITGQVCSRSRGDGRPVGAVTPSRPVMLI